MDKLFGFILQFLSGGIVDKVLGHLERRADAEVERDKLRTQTTIEVIRAAVQSEQTMADFNKSKLSFPLFWVLICMFVVPLALWWTAIIADSIFNFPFDIANLPTPELREMAADMIAWLFFVGTGLGGLRLLVK